ncbi:MAG: substrate-binding domain-containing protein [Eubacteriales bacterium]|nr:substrate-binding domain-containing protein [Eubacteriales bacterium]
MSKKIMRVFTTFTAAFCLTAGLGCLAGAAEEKAPEDIRIALIVQQSDPWYDDMELGVKQFKEDTGVDAFVLTPESSDPALQNALVEELTAQKVDVICVNPNDPMSLTSSIQKARDAGIPVITHESPDIADQVDLDLEAFQDEAFGQLYGESLAKAMDGKGQYCGFVASLTMTSHMNWYKAAIEYISENYPEMELISEEPFVDENDFQVAYDKTLELLKSYPDLKGVFDCSIHGAGISQALIDKEMSGEIKVVSLAQPSMSAEYLKNGSMQFGQGWRPYDTGYALMAAGLKLAKGETIENGTDLGITGYDNLTLQGHLAFGDASIEFTAENIDDYDY